MKGGTIHLYCQQRCFVHPAEQEKVYVGQRISGVCGLLFRQHGVVFHQIDQGHMGCTVDKRKLCFLKNILDHSVGKVFFSQSWNL